MSKKYPRQVDKLWVGGFTKDLSNDDLENYLKKFGEYVHTYRTKSRTDVFVTYMSPEHAAVAKEKFQRSLIRVGYAYDKSGDQTEHSNSTNDPSNSPSRQVHFTNGNSVQQNGPEQQSNGFKKSATNQHETQTQLKKAEFRNDDDIIIIHVRRDFLFYARPKSWDAEYHQLIENVTKLGNTSEPMNQLPRKADLALVAHNGGFARALIHNDVKSKHDEVIVLLVDYGVTAEVPFNALKMCPKNLSTIRFATGFYLEGSENIDNPYAISCFTSFIGSTLKLKCDELYARPRTAVQLVHPIANLNINELIKCMVHRFSFEKMTRKPAPIGENKELTVIDNSQLADNRITFVSEKDKLTFNKQHNQTQPIGMLLEKFPPYLPNDDELCLVKFEDIWYRGSFDKDQSNTSNAVFFLVDFQKGAPVELQNIRKLPEFLAILPILSFCAKPDGNYSKTAESLQHTFEVNKIICAKSVSGSTSDSILQIHI